MSSPSPLLLCIPLQIFAAVRFIQPAVGLHDKRVV